jgi:hypothetical protein
MQAVNVSFDQELTQAFRGEIRLKTNHGQSVSAAERLMRPQAALRVRPGVQLLYFGTCHALEIEVATRACRM